MKESLSEKLPKRQEGKLNIYMHLPENSGVGFYRLYLPALKLRDHKLANVLISDFRFGEGEHVEPTTDALFELMNWADVCIVGRRDQPEFYAQWGGIKEFFNIPIILDTDDNVRFVNQENPGYQAYYPGSPAQTMNKYAMMKVFDAITVSTEDLKEFHRKENPRIYVLPNNLDLQEWDKHEKKIWDDGFIRIGFICSAAHGAGVEIIREPIRRILTKYPNVKFLITHIFRHRFLDFPEDLQKRIEAMPWIKLIDWPNGSKGIGLDIGLAPLTDNMFNRAKSNLRWMEYSAAKVATVASSVKPYLCIENDKTGLLAKEPDEWCDAIERLVIDEKKRRQIAEDAYSEIFSNYNLDKNIGLWENVYREVWEKYHQFFGVKKQFQKIGKKKYRKLPS